MLHQLWWLSDVTVTHPHPDLESAFGSVRYIRRYLFKCIHPTLGNPCVKSEIDAPDGWKRYRGNRCRELVQQRASLQGVIEC